MEAVQALVAMLSDSDSDIPGLIAPDRFRHSSNTDRAQEALDLAVPAHQLPRSRHTDRHSPRILLRTASLTLVHADHERAHAGNEDVRIGPIHCHIDHHWQVCGCPDRRTERCGDRIMP